MNTNELTDRVDQVNWLNQLANSLYSSAAYSEADAQRDGVSREQYIGFCMESVHDGDLPNWYDKADDRYMHEEFGRIVAEW